MIITATKGRYLWKWHWPESRWAFTDDRKLAYKPKSEFQAKLLIAQLTLSGYKGLKLVKERGK